MNKTLLIFRNTIDANSVTAHNSGTNVDYLAVPVESLLNISAVQGKVILSFKDGNIFSDSALSNSSNTTITFCNVTLLVTTPEEHQAVKAIWGAIRSNEGGIIVFDQSKSKFPTLRITGIESILRYEAPNASDSIGISCVDGDNSDEEKIRLTDGAGITDDVVLEAGTGLSIARSSDKITFTNTVSGGGIMTLAGAASVDTQTGERFISMSYSTADFSGNIAPMKTPIPLACTLGTLCVSIGGASTDAVVKIYKNASALYTSGSTTWSSAHDTQVFTVDSGTFAAGDTLSFSIDQSTSVDMNYVIATITLNIS
jgi:hypothetical protein